MNPDRAGFLRAIRSASHDYHNYLVFADWLQEHGDDSDQWYAESMRLRAEKELLIQANDSRWRDKAIRLNEMEASKPNLAEGLKDFDMWGKDSWMGGSLSAILKHGNELMGKWPIHSCHISRTDSSIKKFCNQSWIEELRKLRFDDKAAYLSAATELLQRGKFFSLKTLEILHVPINSEFCEAIGRKSSFPALEELTIHLDGLSNRFLNRLGQSKTFPSLKSLELSNRFGFRWDQWSSPVFDNFLSSTLASQLEKVIIRSEELIGAITQSSTMSDLRHIDFWSPLIRSETIHQLCRNSHFPKLETLTLGLVEQIFHPLVQTNLFPHLRTLSVHPVEITMEDLQLFCNSFPWKGEGFSLILRSPTLGDEGGRILANAKNLAGLKSLSLVSSNLGAIGTRAIAESPYLRDLEWLSLEAAPIRRMGTSAILSASWPNLKGIDLGKTELNERDLRFLAEHGNMPKLRRLVIHRNLITEKGITDLMNSDRFPMLEEIDVSGLKFHEDFEAEARQRGYRLAREY
jgi:uncharacterized protein (TIGR02996 family)